MGESMRAMGWARSFPVAGGARAGRHWAREHVQQLDRSARAPETVDAVLLTVSELITNAHTHAHADAQLVLSWDSRCLHVSVSDSSTDPPRLRPHDSAATSGRGMVLIDALASGWQTRLGPLGKTVTACFCPPGYPNPHPDGKQGNNPQPDLGAAPTLR